ncbi:hypothetical protein ALC60_08844 [Trachymyrmex zeteki]|uniref:Uncharacterized protein n=1 Tax=Mycetomoellerius zeteki TaxID=64791 RepID=A0A151WWB1_9HYME|nr:hypothetical protein ALC60_08844 [Trachymyrmex zeteki]
MVKQGRELSLFVEQTFADDTAGHWCLAFIDIYEICRYYSSSNPIVLRSNKAFSAILVGNSTSYRHSFRAVRELILTLENQSAMLPPDCAEVFPWFRALTSNWHTPETDETSAVLRGVADRRRETDDSLIHRPPVTSAYLITTGNCE